MKKFIALALCIVTILSMFAGCNKKVDNKDKGPVIPIYLTEEIANFDPAYGNLDDAAMKLMSLLHEGLFKYDANGKVVKAQAASIKKLDKPSKNYYAIEISLKNTSWSDGTPVMASDYIYAWKRILESDFRGEAANMLFCIKNARAVHNGDATIDDLGITDVTQKTIRIEFEGKTDYNQFYEYLASPMLVPLREFVVGRVPADWSSNPSIMVSNGPFTVRSYALGKKLILERNSHYYRNSAEALNKSVTPYRLEINLAATPEEIMEAFNTGALVYNGSIPLESRKELLDAGKLTMSDTMSVMSCIFNTKNELLADANVRKALSLALDRNKIAEIITFGKPIEGLIGHGVFNTSNGKGKDTFREKGEALVSASADINTAKSLLGGKTGSINLVIRENAQDMAVAEYIKSVWDSLGIEVNIKDQGLSEYKDANELVLVKDKYNQAYEKGNFDVILVDYLMFSTDAFGNLASFAKTFAGGAMDMTVADGNYQLAPHISGYDNPEYDALIESIYTETDANKRAELLHQAEKMLLDDMPITPLVQLQNACLKGSDITGLKTDYYGSFIFTKVVLKNREKYESVEETETTTETVTE